MSAIAKQKELNQVNYFISVLLYCSSFYFNYLLGKHKKNCIQTGVTFFLFRRLSRVPGT